MTRLFRVRIKNQLLGDCYMTEAALPGTIIFLGGLPSYLHKSKFAEELVQKGYNVIQPFYYGSWVSGGIFSPDNCLKTVRDTISAIKKNSILELYSEKPLFFADGNLYLGGISFGTNVAQSLLVESEIMKTFLISTVPLWKPPFLEQSGLVAEHFVPFLRRAFPNVYRTRNWIAWYKELTGHGKVFNVFRNNPERMLAIQGSKDSISPRIIEGYLTSEKIPVKLLTIQNAGHSLEQYNQCQLASVVERFLRAE